MALDYDSWLGFVSVQAADDAALAFADAALAAAAFADPVNNSDHCHKLKMCLKLAVAFRLSIGYEQSCY